MATPRELDPRFKNEKTTPEEQERKQDETPLTRDETPETNDARHDDDTCMIVHRQRITNEDGTPGEKIHGPMPREEWEQYEREHKL